MNNLKLPTLKSRRYCWRGGDMIETYKILSKLYDDSAAPGLIQSSVSTAQDMIEQK